MAQRIAFFLLMLLVLTFFINACLFKKRSIIDDLNIADSLSKNNSPVILSAADSVMHNTALANLILQISGIEYFECRTVGFAGRRSTQPNYFALLDSIAQTKELAVLSGHHNPYVRTCAFSCLVSRDTAFGVKKNIFDQHFNDRELVRRFCGCIVDGTPVNLHFYSSIEPFLNKKDKKTIQNQLKEMYKNNFLFQMYIDQHVPL